jgi:hypothetical protein
VSYKHTNRLMCVCACRYTRFLKRHGLIETFDGVGVDSAEMIAQEDELEELEDEDADAGEEEDMSEDDDDSGDAAHESAAQKVSSCVIQTRPSQCRCCT